MSQNQGMIPDTTIPLDPRKRSRNHGRLVITLWLDLPDEVLASLSAPSTPDALRTFHRENVSPDDINKLREEINRFFPYDPVAKIDIEATK